MALNILALKIYKYLPGLSHHLSSAVHFNRVADYDVLMPAAIARYLGYSGDDSSVNEN